jgi:hypothetical protein
MDRCPERFQLITEIAQPLQPIIDVEKSRLGSHGLPPESINPDGIKNVASLRGF